MVNRGLVKVGGVMLVASAAAVALGLQMTDIGHATGFAVMAAALAIGAVYVLVSARK